MNQRRRSRQLCKPDAQSSGLQVQPYRLVGDRDTTFYVLAIGTPSAVKHPNLVQDLLEVGWQTYEGFSEPHEVCFCLLTKSLDVACRALPAEVWLGSEAIS
ncbi:MAG TPA: hypothetical protein VNC61_07570 [Acidimicrobiales bacterium]|nr:hypothetical protein [Acidimicrobiales bacterium]